jgi:hypothetical protein
MGLQPADRRQPRSQQQNSWLTAAETSQKDWAERASADGRPDRSMHALCERQAM